MELKETLVAISDDARSWLKNWARDFTEAEAVQPRSDPRAPNPLAWQLGHLACVEDEVAQLFTTGEPGESLVEPALRAVCATGSAPPTADTRYPAVGELWRLLDRTHERLLQLVAIAEGGDLDRGPRVPNPYFRSLGQAVYEAALHESYHVGEIGALRKSLGKPRIG